MASTRAPATSTATSTNVYCDDLGEVCYYASCYKSYDNGEWQHKA